MLFKQILLFGLTTIQNPHTLPSVGQGADLLIIKAGGLYSYHWTLKGQFI
jgi:hypothetical protein